MTDYAIEGSDYERLQRENERLKAERELAVRVAGWLMDRTYPAVRDILDSAEDKEVMGSGMVASDIRKVLAWYREAQDTEKGGE